MSNLIQISILFLKKIIYFTTPIQSLRSRKPRARPPGVLRSEPEISLNEVLLGGQEMYTVKETST